MPIRGYGSYDAVGLKVPVPSGQPSRATRADYWNLRELKEADPATLWGRARELSGPPCGDTWR